MVVAHALTQCGQKALPVWKWSQQSAGWSLTHPFFSGLGRKVTPPLALIVLQTWPRKQGTDCWTLSGLENQGGLADPASAAPGEKRGSWNGRGGWPLSPASSFSLLGRSGGSGTYSELFTSKGTSVPARSVQQGSKIFQRKILPPD